MDKSQIQKRIRDLLEKADKPKEFIKGFQELLKSYVDKEATKNYQRIIPDAGKFYGVSFPILRVIADEIGKFIQKEPTKAKLLLETIWNEGSFEAREIAGKSLEKFGPKNPKVCLDFVSSVLPNLDNWAVCDNLAMSGVEPIVYSNPELVLPLSEKWIFEKIKEGKCIQVLHIGPYSAETESWEKIIKLMEEKELVENGLHHEIYLSDPRKVVPEKMKTILRQPVKERG